jgi:hypothetical protein
VGAITKRKLGDLIFFIFAFQMPTDWTGVVRYDDADCTYARI